MNVLVVAATAAEIKPFLLAYKNNGIAANAEVDVLISGVGLTAATYALTKQIQLKRPGMVIQAGIAGCFTRQLQLADVVLVKKDGIADQLVIEKNKAATLFDLGFIKPNQFPYSKSQLVNNSAILKTSRLKKVSAVSVNEISTDPKRIRLYLQLYEPAIETMEGAALHYVCLSEKIPFIQVRSISNYIGERDKKKWKLNESIISLNNELLKLLNNL